MAAKDYGTVHLYGVAGTVANASVQDFSVDEELANKGTTEDEIGNVIERRSDDNTKTGSITIKIRALYAPPAAGDILTYNGVKYEVTKVGRVEKNKDFRMITLAILTNEYVTLP
jgi:hypothetical protein